MKKQIIGIYKIQNQINDKLYIGSSFDISERIRTHLSKLKNNTHKNAHLQSAINKYNLNNFKFSIIEECEKEDLITKEQYYINSYDWDKLYNKTKIAYGGGSDNLEVPLYLLDLKGDIVSDYKSGAALARFLNKSNLIYKSINTKTITKKQYRIVTKDFYKANLKNILDWKTYSNESEHKKQMLLLTKHIKKYKIIKNNETHCFETFSEIGVFLKLSTERVRQLLNKTHKSTGYQILLNN